MWLSVALSHRRLNTQAVRVSFDYRVTELVVGWTISRADVNRRRRFVTTADADALVSLAGKTAERSAGRTVRQPSICRGDGERVVTTAHASTSVARAGKAAEQSTERSVSRPST